MPRTVGALRADAAPEDGRDRARAPFRHNIFLDADTVPCFDLATLYTQLRAGGGMLDRSTDAAPVLPRVF